MALGDVLGLNYKIPASSQAGSFIEPAQAETVTPFEQAQGQAMLPDLNQDLAYKEKINDHLFNTYSSLKNFVNDMNSKGIDVTKPDYSQPGGGDLYKTYKKIEADIYMTVDDLKREAQFEKQFRPSQLRGDVDYVEGFDPSSQFASKMAPEDVFYTKKLLPEVEFANKQLATSLYTPADVKRFNDTYVDPLNPNSVMSQLQKAIAQPGISPADKAQLQFNIDALGRAAQQTGLSQITQNMKLSGAVNKYPEVDLLREVTNTSQGVWNPGAYTTDVDKDGNVVQVNAKRSGDRFGEFTYTTGTGSKVQQKTAPKIIDRWVKYPDGRVLIEFKQTVKGQEIPAEDVTGMSGDGITSMLISSNPKYGSVAKLYTGAREAGLTTDAGDVDNSLLLAQGVQSEDISGLQQAIDTEKENILTQLKADQFPITFFSPSSGKMFQIKNTLFGNYVEVDGKEVAKRLSDDGVISELNKQGYFKELINKTSAPAKAKGVSVYKKGDRTFTIEDLQQRAKNANRSVEDYIKAAGITVE